MELLVSLSIIVVLFALLLPGAKSAVGAARAYKCQANQRSTAFDFVIFSSEEWHGDRGDDDGLPWFTLEAFQESQYCIDEFWCWDDEIVHRIPDTQGNDPMRCPEVKGTIQLRRQMPCTVGGVSPAKNISFTFNTWLYLPEVQTANGGSRLKRARLTETFTLNNPRVPLFWDLDGEAASDALRSGDVHNVVFTGPSLGSTGRYANDSHWFPGLRHGGRANVAFIDGSVDSSRRPLEENGWSWMFDLGQITN